jgi:hypothetical protein
MKTSGHIQLNDEKMNVLPEDWRENKDICSPLASSSCHIVVQVLAQCSKVNKINKGHTIRK